MPWEETNTMTERMKFISDFENGEETLAELCRQYGGPNRAHSEQNRPGTW